MESGNVRFISVWIWKCFSWNQSFWCILNSFSSYHLVLSLRLPFLIILEIFLTFLAGLFQLWYYTFYFFFASCLVFIRSHPWVVSENDLGKDFFENLHAWERAKPHAPWPQTILQSYSNQRSTVLEQNLIHR